MSSTSYTPLSVRISTFAKVAQQAAAETRRSNPTLLAIAKKLNRDPTIILLGPLLFLTATLLLNPAGVAPGIANILAFIPSIATLRQLDRPHSTAKVEQGKMLLDYWVCIGTSCVVEQVLSPEVVDEFLPVWWLIKGMAGIAVWMSIDVEGRKLPVQVLSLNTSKAKTTDTLPHPEPSPSPVSNSVSALASSPYPLNHRDSSSPTPIDTSDFLRYNAAPHTILQSKAPLRNKPTGLTWGATQLAPGTSYPIPLLSPRDQLDAFLDDASEAATYRRTVDAGNTPPISAGLPRPHQDWSLSPNPDSNIPSNGNAEEYAGERMAPPSLLRADTIPNWSERRNPADYDDGSDGELSPEFIFDGLLPDSAPLTRLSGHAEALDGGPQAKDKAGEGWKQDMTLDDLLEMEQRGM